MRIGQQHCDMLRRTVNNLFYIKDISLDQDVISICQKALDILFEKHPEDLPCHSKLLPEQDN